MNIGELRMRDGKEEARGRTVDMPFVSGYGEDLIEHLIYLSDGPKQDAVLAWKVINNYPEDIHEFLAKVVMRDLPSAVSPSIVNEVYGKDFVPDIKYMKPANYFLHRGYCKNCTYTVVPRMLGYRCIITKNGNEVAVYSVAGKVFSGFAHIVNEIRNWPMDKIAIIGVMTHRNKEGLTIQQQRINVYAVKRKADSDELIYYIDDLISYRDFEKRINNTPYIDRRAFIDTNIIETENIKITPVIYRGTDVLRLPRIASQNIDNKTTEALLINIDDDPYYFGQSRSQTVIKEIHNADLMILDYLEDEERPGEIKAFIVDYKGHDVAVSLGYTMKERAFYWFYGENYLGWVMQLQYSSEITDDAGNITIKDPVFIRMKPIGTKIRYSY